MQNEFTGRVHGPSFQIGNVHGGIHLHGTPAPNEPDSPAEPEPEAADGPKVPIRTIFAGIVLIGVIILIANACGSSPEDPAFPDRDQGTRPVGATDDAVAQLVFDRLERCATASVLAPSNCPQTHKATSARNIHWELVGDPRDGMQVRWNNDKFMARGTAVMTVSYDLTSGQEFAIEKFHFRAETMWRGEDPQIDSIRQATSPPPSGTIKKERFSLPDGELVKAVEAGLRACVSVTSSPMAPTCPRTVPAPRLTNASWTLDGSPAGNWVPDQGDAEFGLLHGTASCSLRLTRAADGFWDSSYDHTFAVNYEATLVRTADNKARLLEIRQVTS
ncbi:hypothetical protein UK23_42780 [Lentzea aerocolonigenes]|uniref:Uncharacterized protein n=1 Tax=Lentzea aerocolonigenes TaxID=68170 RepID=A0A0F0GFM1_LENAE|nr:hypothetical protein [Lentzea aerocolonigenes]KJK35470.1 hypothetical protein UK23_42780 [Lentzea aerocolonigenes]